MEGINSKERLSKALLQCVQLKPLSEIPLSDILRTACVSKTTFYKYFFDKYDLAKYVWSCEIDKLSFDWSDETDRYDPYYVSCYVLGKMKERRGFYCNLLKDVSEQNSFFQSWLEISMEKNMVLKDVFQSDKLLQTAVKIYAIGCNMYFREWLMNGCKEDLHEVARNAMFSMPAVLIPYTTLSADRCNTDQN